MERLTKHHTIPRCFLKVFPHSKELRKASNKYTVMLTPQEHRLADKDTPEIYQFLRKEFQGKKLRETTIFRT